MPRRFTVTRQPPWLGPDLTIPGRSLHSPPERWPAPICCPAIALAQVKSYAYVPNSNGDDVTIIDVAAAHTPLGSPFTVGNSRWGYGGRFITPNIIVPDGAPLLVANHAAMEEAGFRRFAAFHGGTLRLTGSTQAIVVERSVYAYTGGIHWSAGTNATATRLP